MIIFCDRVNSWHYRKTSVAMFLTIILRRRLKVFFDRNGDGASKVVQDENVLDVNLGKEPVMARRPVRHDGVSGEERVPGEHSLLGLRLQLQELPGEDDVGAPGVLGVKVHFLAVTAL